MVRCCNPSVNRCNQVWTGVPVLQFFEKAAENVKENVGDDVQTDQLIRDTCRNVLEHVSSLPVFFPPVLTCVSVWKWLPWFPVMSSPGQTAVSRRGGKEGGARSHHQGKSPQTGSNLVWLWRSSDVVLCILSEVQTCWRRLQSERKPPSQEGTVISDLRCIKDRCVTGDSIDGIINYDCSYPQRKPRPGAQFISSDRPLTFSSQ